MVWGLNPQLQLAVAHLLFTRWPHWPVIPHFTGLLLTCYWYWQLGGSDSNLSHESEGLLLRIRQSTPAFGNVQDYDTDDDLILWYTEIDAIFPYILHRLLFLVRHLISMALWLTGCLVYMCLLFLLAVCCSIVTDFS